MSLRYRLIGLALASLADETNAHDIYTHLTNKMGESCCDGTDCRPVKYRFKAGGVQMKIGRLWFTIPQDKIEYRSLEGDSGETSGGHWCGTHSSGLSWEYLNTRCAFLPPKFTSTMKDQWGD